LGARKQVFFVRKFKFPIFDNPFEVYIKGRIFPLASIDAGWATLHIKAETSMVVKNRRCCAPLHEECLEHHVHKGDLEVTPGTWGAIGERAQVILVWVRAHTFKTPPTHENYES
jgi:hypothetical protein